MGKHINAAAKYPIFGLSDGHVHVSDGEIRRIGLVHAGGGGSARSGIQNGITVCWLNHNDAGQPTLVDHVEFLTGTRLCISVDASKDEKLIAASTSGGTLLLSYDEKAKTIAELCTFDTDESVDEDTPACQNAVKFSPTNPMIVATCGDDGTASLWELGKTVSVKKKTQDEDGTKSTPTKEKETTTSGNDDDDGDETDSGDKNEGKNEEKGVEISKKEEETEKVTAGYVWSAKRLHHLKGHTKAIKTLCFHPSGDILATISGDKTCRIWDVKEGIVKQLIPADAGAGMQFRCCEFVSENRFITIQAQPIKGGSSFIVEFLRGEDGQWLLKRSNKIFKALATMMIVHPPFITVGNSAGDATLIDFETLGVLKTFQKVHSLPVTGMSTLPNPQDPTKSYIITASFDKTVTFLPATRPFLVNGWKFVFPIFLILFFILVRFILFATDDPDNTTKEL